jgi:hypothetical protein
LYFVLSAMKRLAQFCVRRGFLPDNELFRRWMRQQLRYRPNRAHGGVGYYDLGYAVPKDRVDRFIRWVDHER